MRAYGFGLRFQDLAFRVEVVEMRAIDLGLRVQDLASRVEVVETRAQGPGRGTMLSWRSERAEENRRRERGRRREPIS